mmetsp:Transcript_113028/g.200349  ORF Transcript_113028/g.200349 Transcript_113028/m.200349 type:complete len:550 (+) Transcript_113028:94-1743(+)
MVVLRISNHPIGQDDPVYFTRRAKSTYARPQSRPCSGTPGTAPTWHQVLRNMDTKPATSRPVTSRPVTSRPNTSPPATIRPFSSRPQALVNGIVHDRLQQSLLNADVARDTPHAQRNISFLPRLAQLGPEGFEEAFVELGGNVLKVTGASPAEESTRRSPRVRQPSTLSHSPYHWSPIQRRQHGFIEGKYFMGTYVNTLSMNFDIEDATWQEMDMAPDNFLIVTAPLCTVVGGKLVICNGMVNGIFRQDHSSAEGKNAYIARLPEGLRPRAALQFAALGRIDTKCALSAQPKEATSDTVLVWLVVTPDGWIQGVARHEARCIVDLSAVRFCLGRGIAIADEVRLHSCDFGGSRMVVLQGILDRRIFSQHGMMRLTYLPQACRPKTETVFATSGRRAGGYHLITVKPTDTIGFGAEIIWSDSIWEHDGINLSGVAFEAAAESLQHSLEVAQWTENRKKIIVSEFQKFILKRFESFDTAWQEAFDIDHLGYINFTKFGHGCRKSGYTGNLSRLWAMLDDDQSGEITLDEFSVELGEPNTGALSIAASDPAS